MKVLSKQAATNATFDKWSLAIAFVVLSSSVLLTPTPAAAQWKFDPVLRAAWDFDDNATLTGRTDEEIELSGYIAEASVDLVYESPNAFFSFRPMLRSRNYGNESAQNSDDQFARLYGLFEGEKNDLRLLGDFSRESVRTAELADAGLDTDIDPDEIADDQTGLVSIRERRERYRISPSWTYRFSKISSIETALDYLTVAYDDTEGTRDLFDFNDMRLRFGYRRNFSARNAALFTFSVRDFDTDRFGGDRTTYSLMAGFARLLSETTRFRARVGIESIDQDDVGLQTIDPDPQPVFDISLTRRLETIRLIAQYRQRVNSSGQGVLTQRDELNLRFIRDLNDRFSAGLGVRAYTTSNISGTAVEQDYVQLRGQVLWRITRAFFMQADYRHTVIDRDFSEGSADSNRVTVWFTYQPNPVGRDPRLGIRF